MKSNKAKGRRGQNEIRDLLRKWFPELEMGDIESRTMGNNGTDIILSPAALKKFPFAIEVKNSETLNIYKTIEQAKSNQGQFNWLIFFRKNRMDFNVVMNIKVFENLLKQANYIKDIHD